MVSLSQGKWTPQATSSKSEQRKVKSKTTFQCRKEGGGFSWNFSPKCPKPLFHMLRT